jgi:hypothetical protein
MVPENKQNRRYKKINFIGLQNNRHPHGGNPRTCDSSSIPKEAFSDSFQKLYERCQKYVVKGGDYFEGQ